MANGNDNSLGTQVIVDDTLNTDNSVNTETDVELEVEDSFNTDNSSNDSGNQGSYNQTLTDNSDRSVNGSANTNVAGPREYNTTFNNLTGAQGLGSLKTAGGDVSIVNNSTTLDQSINQNIWAGGDVAQAFGSTSGIVASGAGSQAAGGDITVNAWTDNSTTITAGGDAVIGNTTTITNTTGSYNSWADNSKVSTEIEVEFEDSFNQFTETNVSITDSLNDTLTNEISNHEAWDIDTNVVWGSTDSGIVQAEDIAVDTEFELEF